MEDPIRNEDGTEVYDPMAYDVLRETANLLHARYIALRAAATTEEERERWLEVRFALRDEIRNIDPKNMELVRAKTAELAARHHAESSS